MTERVTLGSTDGFRGHAELENTGAGIVNEETFAVITAAHISILKENGEDGPVVIGRDTRPTGHLLKHAVIAGARSQGAEVIDLDIVPTPTAQKVAQKLGAMATVVITASHNHVDDNGWKGMIGSDKPSAVQSKAISERYWDMVESGFVVPRDSLYSSPKERDKYSIEYAQTVLSDIRNTYGADRPLEGKIIVVDGAYGAGKEFTPAILRALGATVKEYACDEGVINDRCGANNLTGLREFLSASPDLLNDPNFLGAVANDGDADRMMAVGVVRNNGKNTLVNVGGNHVMWALAQEQPGIVGTDYTNGGLVSKLKENNIGFEYCENGDVNVTAALREKQIDGLDWRRGGEFTGHYVNFDWLSSGDGVHMSPWFAAWCVERDLSFGDMYKQITLWPDKMQQVIIPDRKGKVIQKDPELLEAIYKAEAELGDNGRLLLRPSGTEHKIFRVWGEGKDDEQLNEIIGRLSSTVSNVAERV